MRKHSLFLIIVSFVVLSFTSCSSEMKPLTERDVVKSVKEFYDFGIKNYSTNVINTGYYELNSEEARLKLRKMQAAGLINYKVEYFEEEVRGYYWNTKKEHYVVSVSLTEEGKKYQISEEEYNKLQEEKIQSLYDKDLKNDLEEKEYPEDKVGPEVISNMPQKTKSVDNGNVKENKTVASSSSSYSSNDNAQMSAYDKVKAKFVENKVYVKLFKFEVVKARKIKCTPDMMKEGRGYAEVITEYVDVTPFGRILSNVKEGNREAEKVELNYYEDEGWTFEDTMVPDKY